MSDFSGMTEQFEAVLHEYNNSGETWAVRNIELMRRERTTGDISYQTISMVILDPYIFEVLAPILPILGDPKNRHVFRRILEDILEKLSKERNSDESGD
jgi:hypothetical protein